MNLYTLKDLKKIYNGKAVLDISRLVFQPEKIYCLLGPNGSGKTTLLNILAFLLPPSQGSMTFNGDSIVFTERCLFRNRRKAVYVNQSPVMFSASVYKNVAFGPKMRKLTRNEMDQRVDSSLDLVRMRDFIHEDARHLSGGETQRVAIARALACNPDVLLLDEPTANVDVENQAVIENILRDLNSRRISIIFSTHSLIQSAQLAHENIVLYRGKLQENIDANIFYGRIINQSGKTYLELSDKVLIPVETRKSGMVRAVAGRISLADSFAELSGSVVKGRLLKLISEKDTLHAVADIGVPVHMTVSVEIIKKLNITPGDDVYINISDITIL